jgi:hypothetical protein
LSEPFWVNIPGLDAAVTGIEEQSRRQRAILSKLRDSVNSLTDPGPFGVQEKGGREFYAKWKGWVGDWEEGVTGISDGTWDTAQGVRLMAKIFRDANDGAIDMATAVGQVVGALETPGAVGGPTPVDTPPSYDGGDTGTTSTHI